MARTTYRTWFRQSMPSRQADAETIGCSVSAVLRLRGRHHRQRAAVSDPAQGQQRVVPQRPLAGRDPDERLDRVGRAVLAQRLDDRRTKVSLPAVYVADELLAHRAVVVVGGECAHQRRTHELGGLGFERGQQHGRERGIRIMLRHFVRRGPHAIVVRVERLPKELARTGAAQPRQQHRGAKLHVAVRVLVGGLDEQRRDEGRVEPTDAAGRFHAHRVVEVTEVGDRLRQLPEVACASPGEAPAQHSSHHDSEDCRGGPDTRSARRNADGSLNRPAPRRRQVTVSLDATSSTSAILSTICR